MTARTATRPPVTLEALDLPAVMRPVWEAIQAQHPGLPDVGFKLTTDYVGRRYRYLAGVRTPRDRTRPYGDDMTVEFTPSGLIRSRAFTPEDCQTAAESALHALLHEAAHVRDLTERKRSSGHGVRFAQFATDLGVTAWLYVRAHGQWLQTWEYGTEQEAQWRQFNPVRKYRTDWNPALSVTYAATLADLETAIAPWAPLLSEWHRNQPGGGL